MSDISSEATRKQPPVKERATASSAFASIADWSRISGMGRSSIYEALGGGNLRARKVGARTLIDVQHGLAWLNSLPRATIRPHGANSRKQQA